MTDKSDDIKQLFSHLGLDHNVYQEMRTASRSSVTITETPRRWSLLQSVAQPPAVTPIAPVPAPVQPAPVAPPVVASPPPAAVVAPPVVLPAPVPASSAPTLPHVPLASPAAAPSSVVHGGIHRGEPATPLWPSAGPVVPPVAVPAATTGSRLSADESLRLLFQAVRDPGSAADGASTDGFEPPVAPVAEADPVVVPAHGHNRPTRNRPAAAAPLVEAAPIPTPVPAPSPVPAAVGTPAKAESLGSLFDRLRGAPDAPPAAPGRLRLNVPKAP